MNGYVCTEIAENEGSSVTNSWPWLAEALVETLGLDPGRTEFIEHYCSLSYRNGSTRETLDHVDIVWRDNKPLRNTWRQLYASESA